MRRKPFRKREKAHPSDRVIGSGAAPEKKNEELSEDEPRRKTVDTTLPNLLGLELDMSEFEEEARSGTTGVFFTWEELRLMNEFHFLIKQKNLWNKPSRSDVIRAAAIVGVKNYPQRVVDQLGNMTDTTGLRLKKARNNRTQKDH